LIPAKLLDFQSTVNVTLGLPFTRTSPDHGTADNIAWKGNADQQPMISALLLAARLAKHVSLSRLGGSVAFAIEGRPEVLVLHRLDGPRGGLNVDGRERPDGTWRITRPRAVPI